MIRINALSFAKMIRYMQEVGVFTIHEVADHTGLHYVTVRRYVKALHREKALHIDAWDKDSWGRDAIKIYAFGPGSDAKRTKIKPALRAKRYRAKIKMMTAVNAVACPAGGAE